MQSLIPRLRLPWLGLLLLFDMSVSVGATPEEGAILLNWRNNMTHTGGELANWGSAGSSDPCESEVNWSHVFCDNNGYVQRLNLDSLGLSGTLAAELGLLSKLETLSLSNNSLRKSIPREIGNLSSLVLLNVSENEFSGPIPDTLAKLTNLQHLNLENNEFSGSFPEALTRLPGLPFINLDSNSISGMFNVSRLLQLIEATSTIYQDQPPAVVSLMNNNITAVSFHPGDVLNNITVIKIQGNPYCNASMDSYDDGRRCFCNQNCSLTATRQGIVLSNWINQLRPTGIPPGWKTGGEPCGSNPWPNVACNSDGFVSRIDIGNAGLEGRLIPELGELSALETLSLYSNNLSGTIPQELGNLTRLSFLDLSYNQFSGPIPKSLGNLGNLSYLTLYSNSLTGTFPESFLHNLPLEVNLGNNSISGIINYTRAQEIVAANAQLSGTSGFYVRLGNNSITDVIYTPSTFSMGNVFFSLQGNPYCYNATKAESARRCFCEQDCSRMLQVVKTSQRLGIIIATTICTVVLLFAFSVGVMYKRHAKLKLHKLQVEYQNKFAKFEVNPQPFLYNELRFATQDFNEITKLGQGGFGTVYKGILSNGIAVAIKKLEWRDASHGDIDDFLNEVVLISKTKHRNLINLKGYCMRGKDRLLVYEYIENMDVEKCLLMSQKRKAMTWHIRFNICLGVAQGLHYLHTYAEPRVIHRDIKASNILLDDQYVPKIADFGLALLFPDEKTHISTAGVAGTRGYLAPEYVLYGQLSEKVDVYSFGVLCLEVISGQKNIDHSRPVDKVYLPNWAWILYGEGKLKDLIDPSMGLHVDEEMEVLQSINIALSCLQQNPDRRPSMDDVQSTFQGKMKFDLLEHEMLESSILMDLDLETSLTSPI